jgi:hypothetical protein
MNPVWHFLNGVPQIPVINVGVSLAGDGSASAPSYSFANDANSGDWLAANDVVNRSIGGTAKFQWTGSGFTMASDGALGWRSSTSVESGSVDVSLSRGAADRLDLASGDSFRIVSGNLEFGAHGSITNFADGVLGMRDAAGTGFNRLILGTNDASGVSLAKSGTVLSFRTGSDSAYIQVNAGVTHAAAGTATTAGGLKAINTGTTSDFGIFFGSGAPTVSAAQGSIYLRSDGSSTSTRLYVNSSAGSGTTWTNVTTAT